MWEWYRKIRPSRSPIVITRQASWCQSVIIGTDFSTPSSHSWWILILGFLSSLAIISPRKTDHLLLYLFVFFVLWVCLCLWSSVTFSLYHRFVCNMQLLHVLVICSYLMILCTFNELFLDLVYQTFLYIFLYTWTFKLLAEEYCMEWILRLRE